MEVKSMLLFVIVALIFLQAEVEAIYDSDSNQIALDGCQSECYGVQVPYPFGIGNSSTVPGTTCFLEKSFELTCNSSSSSLVWGINIRVKSINISQSQADMVFGFAKVCFNSSNGDLQGVTKSSPFVYLRRTRSYTVSSKDNKFVTVGCYGYGRFLMFTNNSPYVYTSGCSTRCDYGHSTEMVDRECFSGNGCCEADFPTGMKVATFGVTTSFVFKYDQDFDKCIYSFVVKKGNYTFSKFHLKHLPFKRFPVVFDWSVGNQTCEESLSRGTNVCKGNSRCVNAESGYGYQCQCNQGYEGNPYLHGCTDINECDVGNHTCLTNNNCLNTIGSYQCFCPKGQSGNGTKEDGCHKKNFLPRIIIGASAGFMAILVGTGFLYLTYQKRKLTKLKEKFFKQNGGLILLQQLSTREESSHTTQIFTSEQLKKATNNYDNNLVVGRGGFGTVYKGVLKNDTVVAIKKSKTINADQVEQFINEVIVLSQINHRNVVKLLGCCLETEVPLLVYEFVRNGTLFDFIHNENKRNNFNWENRLRVAAEAAGALSYLHSAASIPIIHRDVKSANILLDEDFSAKVSDFGTSRFIPGDQVALATLVQGTMGYLDPEYIQTNQLTEKSDVYSFGVVLAELLTGEKALSFARSEEKANLAIYFLSCLKENGLFEALQVGMLNEDNKQEIIEVANITAKCLSLEGEERPYMKEVAVKLEGIREMSKQQWVNNADNNFEETQSQERHDSIANDEEALLSLAYGR